MLIGYADNFPQIKQIVLDTLKDYDLLLKDEDIVVGLQSYDTHNIILAVRPFVSPDNYWDAVYGCHERIKKAFSDNNIKMAYSEGVELGPIGS